MTMVPAAMKLFGRAAWWLPRSLDRALPDLDIEGSKLDAEPAHPTPASGEPAALPRTPHAPPNPPGSPRTAPAGLPQPPAHDQGDLS